MNFKVFLGFEVMPPNHFLSGLETLSVDIESYWKCHWTSLQKWNRRTTGFRGFFSKHTQRYPKNWSAKLKIFKSQWMLLLWLVDSYRLGYYERQVENMPRTNHRMLMVAVLNIFMFEPVYSCFPLHSLLPLFLENLEFCLFLRERKNMCRTYTKY